MQPAAPPPWLPNAISLARLGLSLALPFLPPGPPLVAAFVACGLSDALDGAIARRWGLQSRAGAFLDSAGDLAFFGALLARFLLVEPRPGSATLVLVGAVAGIRLAALLACLLRNRRAYVLHSLGNKVSGLAIFLGVLAYFAAGTYALLDLAVAVSAAAGFEELLVMLLVRRPDPDTRSLRQALRSARGERGPRA